MSCNRPLQAHRTPGGDVRIGHDHRGDGRWMELPCGKCLGCRKDRARAWKIRILHEAQMYDSNLCLTLTYDEHHLPDSYSIEYRHFQLFMKRLRKNVGGANGSPLRYFVCGEYGGFTGRPHFHAIVFNLWFPDMVPFRQGYKTSSILEDTWSQGDVSIGLVDARSAAYVAGYVNKKVFGCAAADHYDLVDKTTGEVVRSRRPELVAMSRRPGIGARWYQKYHGDIFPEDHAVVEGTCYKVPAFYWLKFKKQFPLEAEAISHRRYLKAAENKQESTPERRAVREEWQARHLAMFAERAL